MSSEISDQLSIITTFQHYYQKLSDPGIVTNIWNEIISGRRLNIPSQHVIEYSFHYPVDTEMYLQELLRQFEHCMSEDFRTIEGSLKAYIQTFIYYCLGSADRIPIKTSLYAAELYLKILMLPSNIGKLYYEKNICIMLLHLLNNCCSKQNVPLEELGVVLKLLFEYVSQNDIGLLLMQGTANLYGNIVKYRAIEGDIKQNNDQIAVLCLNCLKNLIIAKEHPQELKSLMQSLLRCLRNEVGRPVSQAQKLIAINISKKFIKDVLFVEIEDKCKLQYFLDALFCVLGSTNLNNFVECVDIINILDEPQYKEVLRRIPNYLESKNHEIYYSNLMQLVYYMLANPHPKNFAKLDVLFIVGFKSIILHLLNKKKQLQCRTVHTLSKICLLKNNKILKEIFKSINLSSSLVGLEMASILQALVSILSDPYTGNSAASKCVLHILSTILIELNNMDEDLSCQIIYLVCKDGTPFSIKNILPNLHELFLRLSGKYLEVRTSIMRILVKMAMHSDATATEFLQHLYRCVIFNSTVEDVLYEPVEYSSVLFSEEFDYELFLAKCRPLIKYDHVYQVIIHFKYNERGHSILLHSLLNYIDYTEYDILTDYILANFNEVCEEEACGHLFNSYKRILLNKRVYRRNDLIKFKIMHRNLWDALYEQSCCISGIRAAFDLIDTLRSILELEDEEEKKVDLLTLISECAYRALQQEKFHMGSIMHLTEVCIALRRPPRNEILVIFENVLDNPRTMSLIKNYYKDTLVQVISFFGTIAMIYRSKIPIAMKFFNKSLKVPDPTVQLTALRMFYNLSTEIHHEYEDIIKFCFSKVTSRHTILSRLCMTILEELIHNNYILLNSEDFMRFVHRLASFSLGDYMMHILSNRFLVSNKHDIGRFYLSTLVYMSGHTKLDSYPIEESFREDLNAMRALLDCPNDLIQFLFSAVQVKTRFCILKEICSIFDSLTRGRCTIDDDFFVFFKYCLCTFKSMTGKPNFSYTETFYAQVHRSIEKQIFKKDPKYVGVTFYGEYESDVKKCTTSLLELLFFTKEHLNEQLCPVFDVLACWIDHIKAELVQYVQYEKCGDFDRSLRKFAQLYSCYKSRLENFVNNQEK